MQLFNLKLNVKSFALDACIFLHIGSLSLLANIKIVSTYQVFEIKLEDSDLLQCFIILVSLKAFFVKTGLSQ